MTEIDELIESLVELCGDEKADLIADTVYGSLDYMIKDYKLLRGISENEDWSYEE
ncbi:MAG: hypothetical protein GY941_22180 [Planctomycetes bacterium]|nr:hypothetical protein [Planctomycetota bacterium]